MVGETISHYKVLSELGRGGMGIVYKAEDLKLRRTVALKFLRSDLIEDPEHRERFLREAQAAAALDHPNICTVYEIDEADGQTFLSMAYLEGQTVKEKIKARPLKLDEALDIAIQTAQGLQAAHEKGIVHRDIKSSNLMITPQGQVKIMDFGLAQLADRSKLTKTTASLGTPSYMSPEQAQKSKTDRRTDIWSLGVVVYEMVTGRLPFEREREQAVLYSIVNEEPEVMTAQRVDVPVELDRIVSKAMAKIPVERYQHVEDFAVDLRGVKSDARSAVRVPVERGSTASRPVIQTNRGPRAVAAFLLGCVLAGSAVWILVGDGDRAVTAPTYKFTRLTYDSGLSFEPSISRDGKLVSYASDRAGEGNLDIWVQQVAGGDPIRLTSARADEREPSFSPDGSQVVFRSDRDGGIYVVSALGGEPRFLASDGRRPRFSPDGTHVAYWSGAEAIAQRANTEVRVVPTEGGEVKLIGPGRSPVWSPDGRRLLAVSNEDGQTRWETIPLGGGEIIRANVPEVLLEHGLSPDPRILDNPFIPQQWLADQGVIVSARLGESDNLWKIPLSPESGRVSGAPVRLTTGSSNERHAAVARNGTVVLSSVRDNSDIWILGIDSNTGAIQGEPERITSNAASDFSPSLALNGLRVAFASRRSGNIDIWVKDLDTGRLVRLTATEGNEAPNAIMHADGERVVFRGPLSGESEPSRVTFWVPASGGSRHKVSDELRPAGDWSRDGSTMVHFGLQLFDVPTGEVRSLFQHDMLGLDPRFSPDARWVVFHERVGTTRRQVFVVPIPEQGQLSDEDLIPITDGTQNDFHAAWSPDGALIYFGSDRDGFRCIYAQPVDPKTKLCRFSQNGRADAPR